MPLESISLSALRGRIDRCRDVCAQSEDSRTACIMSRPTNRQSARLPTTRLHGSAWQHMAARGRTPRCDSALHPRARPSPQRPLSLEQRVQIIEDRAALKALVDTFSNLADAKDVKSQVLLFTEDATVDSHVGGSLTSSLKGREEIGQRFSEFPR